LSLSGNGGPVGMPGADHFLARDPRAKDPVDAKVVIQPLSHMQELSPSGGMAVHKRRGEGCPLP